MSHQRKSTFVVMLSQVLLLLISVLFVQVVSSYAMKFELSTVLILSFIVAIPIWLYKVESALFDRRAILTAAANEAGVVKGLLWSGNIKSAFIFVVSYFFAMLIISFGGLFQTEHWFVIYADVFVIVGVLHYSKNFFNKESKSQYAGLFSRRFLHGVNVVLITLCITYLDFSTIGAPDYRLMEWHEVFQQEFNLYFEASTNNLVGAIVGMKAGADGLGWFLMQNFSIQISEYTLKAIAWLLFLIPSAISATFILFILLGALSLAEHKERKDWKVFGDTLTSKSFMGTLLVLTGFYFYAVYSLSQVDFYAVAKNTSDKLSWVDFCDREDTSKKQEVIANKLNQSFEDKLKLTELKVNRLIEEELKRIFISTESGVDDYLDWYYTVTAEYNRLLSAVVPGADVVKMMNNKVQHYVFEDTQFAQKIDDLYLKINQIINNDLNVAESQTVSKAKSLLQADECTLKASSKQLKGFEGGLGNAGVAGVVALGRVSTKSIGKKAGAAIMAKIFGKSSMKLAIKLLGKFAIKKGVTSVGGVTSGAAIGGSIGSVVPVVGTAAGAIVGGIVGGITAWFVVDKILIEAEEIGYRDEMRQEMVDALNEQRPEVEKELKDGYATRIRIIAHYMRGTIDKRFVPARDGMW